MGQPVLTTTNPFRDAYDALWAMLRAKIDFTLLFGAETCFRQVSVNATAYWSSDNDLDHASLGAHPRVRLVVTEINPNTELDSCGSQPTMGVEVKIWTAAQQQGLILDCAWAITRSMLDWRQYVRDTVTWNGQPCIVDVDAKKLDLAKPPLIGQHPPADKPDSKGFNQWIGVWRAMVTFNLSSRDMRTI